MSDGKVLGFDYDTATSRRPASILRECDTYSVEPALYEQPLNPVIRVARLYYSGVHSYLIKQILVQCVHLHNIIITTDLFLLF